MSMKNSISQSEVKAIWQPSPNFEERTFPISHVVLHGTWMDCDNQTLKHLCSKEAKVSCHYFINQQGELYQLVQEKYIAWHAGVSKWGTLEKLNQYSIGIEISNPGEEKGVPYHPKQYATLTTLLKDILKRYNLLASAVIAHSDIAPERKNDPGKHFDWSILERNHVGIIKRKANSILK